MVARAENLRVDSERRAIWLAAIATVALALGGFSVGFNTQGDAWKVAFFVASQAALVASIGLAALSLAPGRPTDRVLFWAFALFWLALVFTTVITSASAIQAVGGSTF